MQHAVHMLHMMLNTTSFINTLRLSALFLSGLYLAAGTLNLRAQDNTPIAYQAEVLGNCSGDKLNGNGFSAGVVQLKKGLFYDVESTSMGSVNMNVDVELVRVSKDKVKISKKIL